MIKRQKNPYKKSMSILSPLSSTLSCSWVPLTLIFLLYTSGITTTIGESTSDSNGNGTDEAVTVKPNYTKTGNPQIDYVHDPNLPAELKGYNLSNYPFFSRVPSNINFSCDGLKDGFYASVEYHCQVYHHCLFGTRYDFLCANFTGFDQKTFICQFVSEIDCPNSALSFYRNDALYWDPTTTQAPRVRNSGKRLRPVVHHANGYIPKTYTPAPPKVETDKNNPPEAVDPDPIDESEEEYAPDPPPRRRKPQNLRGRRRGCKKGRCRTRGRRPRPRPVYYYDEDYYDDDDYYDYDGGEYYDERPNKGRRRDKGKDGGRKVASSKKVESSLTSTKKAEIPEVTPQSTTTTASTTAAPPPPPPPLETESIDVDPTALAKTREEIFTKSRPPPRIRPPVPKYERNKYDAMQGRASATESASSTTPEVPQSPQSSPKSEYDDYYEEDYQSQSQKPSLKTSSTTTTIATSSTTPAPTTQSPRQRLFNFRTSSSSPSRTRINTTPSTTTTTTATTTRPTTKAPTRAPTTQSTTVTTTTTTEAPQYEYEYEYEDDLPMIPSSTELSTTTTTTTTTTEKPSRNNNLRGKRPSSFSSIQTSTSVVVQDDQDLLQIRDEESDASQNAINRRRSSWTKNQPVRTPLSSIQSTPNSIVTTSERFQGREIQQHQLYEEPVITVKVASTASQQSSRTTEPPVTKTRPSRFWQRPAKVVASSTTTTTTDAPMMSADYADYQDEPETIPINRYNNRQKSVSPSTISSSTYRSPHSTSVSSGNSEEIYNNNQYGRSRNQNYNSNSNLNSDSNSKSNINSNSDLSQQYLRPTQNSYRLSSPQSSSTRFSADKSNYAYSPSPSHLGTSSMRPEFISLLREDEDPYYDTSPSQQTQLQNPHPSHSTLSSSSNNRRLAPPQRGQYFGNQPYHQSQKNLYGAAQETYSTFVDPPSRYNVGFMNDFGHGLPPMMFPYGNQPHQMPMMSGK